MTRGNHSKGKAMERKLIEHLGVEGFIFPMAKFDDADAFGVFDGLFIQYGYVFFIQVCHRSTVARHKKAIQSFVDAHPGERWYQIELWSWKARKTALGAGGAQTEWRCDGAW